MTRIIRINELQGLIGLSKATIWRYVRSGGFPSPIKLNDKLTSPHAAVGWRLADVEEWIANRKCTKQNEPD